MPGMRAYELVRGFRGWDDGMLHEGRIIEAVQVRGLVSYLG